MDVLPFPLAKPRNMELRQCNGQRIYGPPAGWVGPAPPRGSEVFIKVPRDMFEDKLLPILEQVGTVYELRMMMDFSGTNRGFCFATYASKEQALLACKLLDNFPIKHNRNLGITLSVDNRKLFIGGIPRDKGRDDILDEVRKHTDYVINVIVYQKPNDKSKNRGYAFVEYESHKAATTARKKFVSQKITLWSKPVVVDWADPEPDISDEAMSKVKSLFVRNLADCTTEDTIEEFFERAAGQRDSIQNIKRIRDYAFISFYEREPAIKALENTNGKYLDGYTIEVSLAKPDPRNQSPDGSLSCTDILECVNLSDSSCQHEEATAMRKDSPSSGSKKFTKIDKELNYWHKKIEGCCFVSFLDDLCRVEEWGKPQYYLQEIKRIARGSLCAFYAYKVVIHGLAQWQDTCVFQPVDYTLSRKQAMEYAALHVLSQIKASSLHGCPSRQKKRNELDNEEGVQRITTIEARMTSCEGQIDAATWNTMLDINQDLAKAYFLLNYPCCPTAPYSQVYPETTHGSARKGSASCQASDAPLGSPVSVMSDTSSTALHSTSPGTPDTPHSYNCPTPSRTFAGCGNSNSSGVEADNSSFWPVSNTTTPYLSAMPLCTVAIPLLVQDANGQQGITFYMPGM